jgi:hypothetical protein
VIAAVGPKEQHGREVRLADARLVRTPTARVGGLPNIDA